MNEDGVYGKIFKILIKEVTTAEENSAELHLIRRILTYEWTRATAALLEELYPSDIFTGDSGDPGPTAIMEIKKQLNAYLKRQAHE